LYDIHREVREMNRLGTVDSMFLLYGILREVREMNSSGTVDSRLCSYYMTCVVKLER
jgi:hypothetical protein